MRKRKSRDREREGGRIGEKERTREREGVIEIEGV